MAAQHKRASVGHCQVIVVEGTHAAIAAANEDLVRVVSVREAGPSTEGRDTLREKEEVVVGRGGLVREAAFGALTTATREVRSGKRGRLCLDVGPQADLVNAFPVRPERELKPVPVDEVRVDWGRTSEFKPKKEQGYATYWRCTRRPTRSR